ncbi:putative basic proline-rich protein-like [Iris pallida]|uniref:Basic proline-rich protein-like n=1 Tax=Iris pallida TaxID=29817 RepID=A0AAX6FTE6_IRIPA|nr:putative basic proline-rich protein-like [Iris pallida]
MPAPPFQRGRPASSAVLPDLRTSPCTSPSPAAPALTPATFPARPLSSRPRDPAGPSADQRASPASGRAPASRAVARRRCPPRRTPTTCPAVRDSPCPALFAGDRVRSVELRVPSLRQPFGFHRFGNSKIQMTFLLGTDSSFQSI